MGSFTCKCPFIDCASSAAPLISLRRRDRCTHANSDAIVILDEKAMLNRIFTYTDRIYKIVKPRRVFYLAVDGVAPRAKMVTTSGGCRAGRREVSRRDCHSQYRGAPATITPPRTSSGAGGSGLRRSRSSCWRSSWRGTAPSPTRRTASTPTAVTSFFYFLGIEAPLT